MAKFISTTFGEISGKHGTAVAVKRANGENILRVYKKPANPKTPAQMRHRAKFGFVNQSLASLSKIFKTTFRNSRGINQAVSYAMRNAVTEEGGEWKLEYEKLLFASGSLQLPEHLSGTRTDEKTLTFTWDTTLDVEDAFPDELNVVLMNAETRYTIVREGLALRDAGTTTVSLPEIWQSAEVLAWVYFSSPESNTTTNSKFVAKL